MQLANAGSAFCSYRPHTTHITRRVVLGRPPPTCLISNIPATLSRRDAGRGPCTLSNVNKGHTCIWATGCWVPEQHAARPPCAEATALRPQVHPNWRHDDHALPGIRHRAGPRQLCFRTRRDSSDRPLWPSLAIPICFRLWLFSYCRLNDHAVVLKQRTHVLYPSPLLSNFRTHGCPCTEGLGFCSHVVSSC